MYTPFVKAISEEFSKLNSQDQIIVIFIQMYNSKAMERGVAWFFLDHRVDHLLPSREAKTVACGVLNAGMGSVPQGLLVFSKSFDSSSESAGVRWGWNNA